MSSNKNSNDCTEWGMVLLAGSCFPLALNVLDVFCLKYRDISRAYWVGGSRADYNLFNCLLNRCNRVTPYGVMDLVNHCYMQQLRVWRHQAIYWYNAVWLAIGPYGTNFSKTFMKMP